MRITPPGELERAMIQHAAQIRARLLNPVVCKRPDEPMPEPDARSEPVEEKIEEPEITVPAPEPEEPVIQPISCKFIMEHIAAYYRVSLLDLVSERRAQRLTWPRHIAMYLAKKLTTRSFPSVGRAFGGRDHTTVLHAIKRIEGELDRSVELRREVAELTDNICARAAPIYEACERTNSPSPKVSGAAAISAQENFWTAERVDELKRLWRDGWSIKAIGLYLGRHHATIQYTADKLGLPKRSRSWVAQCTPRDVVMGGLVREVPFG